MQLHTRVSVFLFVTLSSLAVLASPTPSSRVQETMDDVIAVLQQKQMSLEQRRQRIREIIAPRFDFRVMSQIILTTTWKRASDKQRKRFVALFQRMLENTYIVAMEAYSGEQTRLSREKLKGKRALVETVIISDTADIPVSYKMHRKNGDWYAYDVIIDGVSLISNYRSSFRNVIREKGVDGLLEQMEQKVAEKKP